MPSSSRRCLFMSLLLAELLLPTTGCDSLGDQTFHSNRDKGIDTQYVAESEENSPILVNLEPGFDSQDPILATSTIYRIQSLKLAFVPRGRLKNLQKAGALAHIFPTLEKGKEWYIARIHDDSETPPSTFIPLLKNDNILLYKVSPSEVGELGAHGAHLVRLSPLPHFENRLNQETQRVSTPSVSTALPALLNEITEESWSQIVRELSGDISFNLGNETYQITSRHTEHPDNTLIGDYLIQIFQSYGYEVESQTFLFDGELERNIVARRKGILFPNSVYVLGGHYDSRAQDLSDPSLLAPGADDNASGVAVVVEAARVLAKQDFAATVEFVLFGAEEQGLIGSQFYVIDAAEKGKRLKGAILTDMTSYWKENYQLIIEGTPRYRHWMSIAVNAAKKYSDLPTNPNYFSFGSDHVSFQNAGIPAYLLIEEDWEVYPDYHTSQDVFNNCDPHMGSEVARIATAALAEAAGML